MGRGPALRGSAQGLRNSGSTQTLDLKLCGPGLISRRGMFQSNRGHLLKDGWLGFYETVI
jgi:hypothetical protein